MQTDRRKSKQLLQARQWDSSSTCHAPASTLGPEPCCRTSQKAQIPQTSALNLQSFSPEGLSPASSDPNIEASKNPNPTTLYNEFLNPTPPKPRTTSSRTRPRIFRRSAGRRGRALPVLKWRPHLSPRIFLFCTRAPFLFSSSGGARSSRIQGFRISCLSLGLGVGESDSKETPPDVTDT